SRYHFLSPFLITGVSHPSKRWVPSSLLEPDQHTGKHPGTYERCQDGTICACDRGPHTLGCIVRTIVLGIAHLARDTHRCHRQRCDPLLVGVWMITPYDHLALLRRESSIPMAVLTPHQIPQHAIPVSCACSTRSCRASTRAAAAQALDTSSPA